MAGLFGSFWGGRGKKQESTEAIVGLRQQVMMIEKKEEHTRKKIEEEVIKAKANSVSNKAGTSFPTS